MDKNLYRIFILVDDNTKAYELWQGRGAFDRFGALMAEYMERLTATYPIRVADFKAQARNHLESPRKYSPGWQISLYGRGGGIYVHGAIEYIGSMEEVQPSMKNITAW